MLNHSQTGDELQSLNVVFDWGRSLSEGSVVSAQSTQSPSRQSAGSCVLNRNCPEDHFSFFVQSGAANVVAPKICIQDKLVLGSVLNNAGFGINIVVMNGELRSVNGCFLFVLVPHTEVFVFNRSNRRDVKPLIKLLESIEKGSAVLMASYDDPSSKLSEDARKLIAELGSSTVQSLGFRDNWVFVGGKGATVKSNFEKYMKNDNAKNKYQNWPELVELQGCIPKYLE
ncbi:hypothetical protein L3Q82_023505 [Scortum barcoo]|uniref:Uncharacterized protein n=1 Tax=Scortum barcoo TaxID=214431 RepID=A0ACB8WSX9_9TELE|nr:hypothetical protein L3Q82_023505 [Scortum barcoo]